MEHDPSALLAIVYHGPQFRHVPVSCRGFYCSAGKCIDREMEALSQFLKEILLEDAQCSLQVSFSY